MMTPWALGILAVVLCGLLYAISRYFSLWIMAYVTGTQISLFSLMLMSLRNINPRVVVQCKIMAVQAGLVDFPTSMIEAQILAGGNVQRITLALIAAHRAGIDLDWNTAAAIDLAGRNILEAVQLSVNPKVISCPNPEEGRSGMLVGVAKDGIQLKVRVQVTVRTNLSGLVGGATESTVIARVGEGIISAIGSCESYRDALANPTLITRKVIEAGLDSQTAFAIVSIDIADIDVGANIGAKLQSDQADADIRIARAYAEQRHAIAIAREQEMIALTMECEADVIRAEAEIPAAISTAFRAGQLRARRQSASHPKLLAKSSRQTAKVIRAAVDAMPLRRPRGLEAWETEGGSCA